VVVKDVREKEYNGARKLAKRIHLTNQRLPARALSQPWSHHSQWVHVRAAGYPGTAGVERPRRSLAL
jgi:hypothetical protein